MTSGTPEGSLISPLLFALYINDLPRELDANCLMYADDAKVFRKVSDISDAHHLQDDVCRLFKWSAKWKLKLNPAKCKAFRITLKRSPIMFDYEIDGYVLENVRTIRDLGVVIDEKLTFESHVNDIVLRANRALGVMIRSFQTGDSRAKFQKSGVVAAYCGNVRAILEYCSVIWAGTAKTHAERIERVQHKFLMWLSAHTRCPSPSLSYSDLLACHSFTSLQSRRTQHDLMFLSSLFKHRLDSSYLRSCFGLFVPPRPTRDRVLFNVPFARVETTKNGLFCRLPRHMNDFLRTHSDVDVFNDVLCHIKTQVKSYVKALT